MEHYIVTKNAISSAFDNQSMEGWTKGRVLLYYLRHKKRGSVFLAYLRFLSLKFKKLYEFCGKNQII